MLAYRSVFVTGSSGFAGQRIVKALRARLLPDAKIWGGSTHVGPDQLAFDLLDRSSIMRAIEQTRPDLVVHLAAQSSVGQARADAVGTWRTNARGTLDLAEAVVAFAPTATILFASSVEVYGAAFNVGTVSETTIPVPLSPYARSKRCAEEMLADVLTPQNRLIVMRPTNHSGPGQDTRFVLPAFADQIAAIEAGRVPPVLHVGSLAAERDFLHVDDVIEAYLAALAISNPDMRETFNIASGTTVRIGILLDMLLAAATVPIAVEPDPARMRPSDVPLTAIDATRLRAATAWAPCRSLDNVVQTVLDDRRRRYCRRF